MLYARVVVDAGASSSIDSLTYEIPDGLVEDVGVGACVLVPLASRQAVGYVVGLDEKSPVDSTRPIIAKLDDSVCLPEDLLQLANWISEQYLCALPRVVAGMLPGVMQFKVRSFVQAKSDNPLVHLTPSEKELLERISSSDDPIATESLYNEVNKASVQRLIRQLESKGVVERTWRLGAPEAKPKLMKGVKVSSAVDDKLISSLPEKQEEAMRVICGLGRPVSLVELTNRFAISRSAISGLEKKGLLESTEIVFRREPSFVRMAQERFALSQEQERVLEAIISAIDSDKYRGKLLFGVTASGKTEVYLRAIEHAMARGKTSLVLLPEIALTTQVMNIFKSRFADEVAVLHSGLSAGERCDEWLRIKSGEAKVVLGARSAVFAPLQDLGLVIVDEEHESSYKQDSPPRYNGRDVAVQRAKYSGAVLVLGSATPSVATYHRALNGELELLSMKSRIEGRSLPTVHIADLREEYAKGKATIFSARLRDAICTRLEKGEQVMLFQNRRAYSTFLLCRDCGHVMKCPNCEVSLKFHNAAAMLSCHHCEYSRKAPDVCPKCQGEKIGRFGIGTERVEEETRKEFPSARVLRMDRDTTTRKGSHGAILGSFRRGEADILIGTQMIAKGLDFPNVTLVGVISADTSLNLPDFRACERTFQMVSQVSGRAGRGIEPGEVVVQTFDPDQYAIQCAVNHDYEAFYELEIEGRLAAGYPPFYTLANIVSTDAVEKAAESRLLELRDSLNAAKKRLGVNIKIDGPNPAVLSKLRGEYRWHLLVRSEDRNVLLSVLREGLREAQSLRKFLSVDVDPSSML